MAQPGLRWLALVGLLIGFIARTDAQTGTPQWVQDSLAFITETTFPENTPLGTTLGQVRAIDPEGTAIKYDIQGSIEEYVSIGEDTGIIIVTAQFDYDIVNAGDDINKRSPNVLLIATDADGFLTPYTTSINIADSNDIPPFFRDTVLRKDLPENTPVNTVVMRLNVTDPDTNNTLIQVTCDRSTARFADACDTFRTQEVSISNKNWTADLILNRALDFETRQSYAIRFRVFDGVNENLQEVQIGVLDESDSPPVFVRSQSSIIDETNQIGLQIDYVSAVDSDAGFKRPIRYELYRTNESVTYFAIDPVTGWISNRLPLDYEDTTRTNPGQPFNLYIRAAEVIDAGPPEQLGNDPLTTATAQISIRLRDVNDNCPTFDQSIYNVAINEDIKQGVNIPSLQMTVTDADSGSRSSFDLELIDQSGHFAVTPTSGRSPASITISVFNAQGIDYEEGLKNYNLQVTARENQVPLSQACSGTATVRIQVNDVNDESPNFDQPNYEDSVREDAAPGTNIIQVFARDRESGLFGQDGIRYSLRGNGDNLFFIDEVTGQVSVADCPTPGSGRCIDYERVKRYDLTVVATDNGGDEATGRVGLAQLIINILNVNDNPPQFRLSYRRSIREGETLTTDPLIIQARDLDGDQLTYSIPSGQADALLWQVNPVSGNVTAIRPIQYSDVRDPTTGEFVFQAIASDGVNAPATVDITIRVIDINDKDPIFLPTNYTISIPETTPGGKFLLQVSVKDDDSPTTGNGQVDVLIESGNFGKFTIRPNRTEGSLTFADIYTAPDATFDYDLTPVYNLRLRAQDRGSPFTRNGTAFVTVIILDTNNKNPYLDPPTHSIQVSENEQPGTAVVTITAYDSDVDARLRYSFAEPIVAYAPTGLERDRNQYDYTRLFRIEPFTGIVRVNSQLDRNEVNFMQVPLFVEDTTVPGQNGTGMLFIRILEYNDQAPQFEFPMYVFNISEERTRGAFIGSVYADDEDDNIESYSLTFNPENLVQISLSGVLTVANRMDYESRHNTTLVAQAIDSGSPPRFNTTNIFINIININDETPIFERSTYEIELLEGETTTAPLLTVRATDLDEGDYGVVRYTIDTFNPYFTINNLTGEISYRANHVLFDRETTSSYTFQVTAYDSPLDASVRRRSSVPVYISILDKNDNCPVFNPAAYAGTVYEVAEIGDQVVELYATDNDSGENAQIQYNIDYNSVEPASGRDMFIVDRRSGRIEVSNSLRKRSGRYTFNVTASDLNGFNTSGQMCTVYAPVAITVQEAINDAPEWIRPPTANFTIDVLESQYLGMLVYDCKARDPNRGLAGILDYSFNVGQQQQQRVVATPEFRINPVTCIIRAEIVYDREAVSSYILTLVAKDRGSPAASSETVLTIRVLDVNDNDPIFPMRNGETIPISRGVPENTMPGDIRLAGLPRGVIAKCRATDADTDHPNNEIFYKIVAGNNDGFFLLNETNCEVRLNPARVPNGLDREFRSLYSMDVLAYNDVNDDTVIRQRRRRSTNPSIVTINIAVNDTNDSRPVFQESQYFGCVPVDAPFAQSILQVKATDQDVVGTQSISYSLDGNNEFFEVEASTGYLVNKQLLYGIPSGQRIQNLRVRAFDTAQYGYAGVTIFVTDPEVNEVKLEISQPSSDVRVYRDQLISVLRNTTGDNNRIVFGCISEIRDHINDDGTVSFKSTDVMMSAVGQRETDGSYFIYTAEVLATIINRQLASDTVSPLYRALYVKNVQVEEKDDELSLTEDPVLAVFIIAILLIFLALILFCLACCLIRNSKKKKIKKLRAVNNTQVEVVRQEPEVAMSVNPMYDNKAYQPDQPQQEVYAVVSKPRTPTDREPQPLPVAVPPIVPVVVPADEPDVYVPEPVVQDYGPEPVIVTEPIMEDEQPVMLNTLDDLREDPSDVPVIETEVLPEDDEQPGLSGVPESEIEVEIRDSPPDSPYPSPPRSRSPSPPPPPQEFTITTETM